MSQSTLSTRSKRAFWPGFVVILALFLSSVAMAEDPVRPLLDKGDIRAAILAGRDAVQAEPSNQEVRHSLVDAYLRIGAGQLAEGLIRQQLQPDEAIPAEWVVPMAWVYLQQARGRDLLADLKPRPEYPAQVKAELIGLRGLAQQGLGDQEAAGQSFDEAYVLAPESAPGLLAAARRALIDGDRAAARRNVDQALKSFPGDVEAWRFSAELYRAEQKRDQALDAYERVLALAPGDLPARLGHAKVLVELGRADEAVSDLDQVLALVPGHPEAHFLYAVIEFGRGNLEAVRNQLVEVFGASPENLRAHLLAGIVALKLNELEPAQAHLSKVLEQAPGQLVAVQGLASVRLRQGRAADAVKLLEPLSDRLSDNPAYLRLLGQAYVRNGQLDIGIQTLQKALEKTPDAQQLRLRVALARMAAGDPAGASDILADVPSDTEEGDAAGLLQIFARIQEGKLPEAIALSETIERETGKPAAAYLRGLAYIKQGDLDAARKAFMRAQELDSDFATALFALARLELKAGNQEQAKAYLEKVLERDAHNLQAGLGLAQLAMLQGRSEEAERQLDNLRRQHPDDLTPGLQLVGYYLRGGRKEQAVEVASALLDKNPKDARALQAMIWATSAKGDLEVARKYAKQLVQVVPENVEALRQLALLQFRTARLDAADLTLSRALKMDPASVNVLSTAVELSVRRKKFDEALGYVRAIQERHPDQVVGYELEGDVQAAAGSSEEAAAAYRRAPGWKNVRSVNIKLARVLRKGGRIDEAEQLLSDWIAAHADDIALRAMLGETQLAAGRADAASETYKKLLERKPEHVAALNNLAWIYAEKDVAQAQALAEKALKLAPDNGAVMDTLGLVLLYKGESEHALKLLKGAFKRVPEDPSVRYHLALAYQRTDKTALARVYLEPLLDWKGGFPDQEAAKKLYESLPRD